MITPRQEATVKAQKLSLFELSCAAFKIDMLERVALERLATLPNEILPIGGLYVGTSGGKDSVAVHHLMSKTDLTWSVLHTNKPEDVHPLTKDFLYRRQYPILYVPKGAAMPAHLRTQFDGSRASEYNRADGRSTDFIVGGVSVSRDKMPLYVTNGLFGLNFVFPMYDWSDEEVWAYIFGNDIEYSDEYLIPKDAA
jgi:3'-phosphoadenosine 5'-phosphosulfate sulfotransferase (PAPS reductase)/FAD synthetase